MVVWESKGKDLKKEVIGLNAELKSESFIRFSSKGLIASHVLHCPGEDVGRELYHPDPKRNTY
jgi:hypothetical protein